MRKFGSSKVLVVRYKQAFRSFLWKGLQNRQEEIGAFKGNIVATDTDEGENTLYESKTRFRFTMYSLY